MQNGTTRALRCAHCGEVIGVYEPTTVLVAHLARETSLAAEPTLAQQAGTHFHRDCFAAGAAQAVGA
ncbi:MAG: hypothetical protein HZB46_03340 [Solirubrobacterales bacterium]|nr:hypothetical protein [Solirubrobacterales bacterium]